MNWIDGVFLLILVIGAAYGVWTGMLWQLANVVGFVAGLVVAGRFSDPLGLWMQSWGRWFADRPALSNGMAYGLVFVAVLSGFQFTAFLLRRLLWKIRFGQADHIAGGVLGFVAGLMACAAIAVILLPAAGQRGKAAARDSFLAPLFMRGMEKTGVFMSDDKVSRARRFLESLRSR